MEVPMSDVLRTSPSRFPMFEAMRRVPGGLMLIPLTPGVLMHTFAPAALGTGGPPPALSQRGPPARAPLTLGVLMNTFAPGALGIGGFTTALFKDGALALIALLVLATGASITGTHNGKGAAGTTLVVLLAKTLIPITLCVVLGLTVGVDGILGVSILGLIAIFGNSNGAMWLAFAGEYGDERDRGAYVASAFDDGPLPAPRVPGRPGRAGAPLLALVAALVPFLIGLFIGAVD